jgi:hypothetical protein
MRVQGWVGLTKYTSIVYTAHTMLQNITLSADTRKIAGFRHAAKRRGYTANALFREWLDQIDTDMRNTKKIDELFSRIDNSGVDAGRKFSREEMNDR